jgi:hypothetical protein
MIRPISFLARVEFNQRQQVQAWTLGGV